MVAFLFIRGRQLPAPLLLWTALLCLSLARKDGMPLLPVNSTILTGWLCMTLVVTFIIMLQPEPVRRQTRGTTYILAGALTGLAVGLLAFSFTTGIRFLYAVMTGAVILGIYCGFLLYSHTPEGDPVKPGSGNFFRYLLAKGFPAAITVMQAGVALVLTLAVYHVQ